MLVIRVVCFFTKTQGTYWKATFLLAFTGKSFCCIDLRSRKIWNGRIWIPGFL